MSNHSKPLISIVTPSFNSERFIEETIRSVMAQGYEPLEHIVIDGGSTDGTLEIVRRYPHVKLVSEPDHGMYDAYNKGLRMATGDLIGCLNSDDQYAPEALSAVAAYFEQHPETDVLIGDAYYVDEAGSPLYRYHALPFKWSRFASMDFSSIVFPSVFWRRSIHERIGYYDDAFRMAADFDFYLRFKSLRVGTLNQVLSLFRIHGASLTYTQQQRSRQEVAEILARHGVADTALTRFKQKVAKSLFILFCYRPPLVMVRRGLKRLWGRLVPRHE